MTLSMNRVQHQSTNKKTIITYKIKNIPNLMKLVHKMYYVGMNIIYR